MDDGEGEGKGHRRGKKGKKEERGRGHGRRTGGGPHPSLWDLFTTVPENLKPIKGKQKGVKKGKGKKEGVSSSSSRKFEFLSPDLPDLKKKRVGKGEEEKGGVGVVTSFTPPI